MQGQDESRDKEPDFGEFMYQAAGSVRGWIREGGNKDRS